jgi:CheY-like chemotaxis protein
VTRILLIEADDRIVNQVTGWIGELLPGVDVECCKSRSSADRALERALELDLVICDLRIPPHDDSVDAREDHGMAVHERAKAVAPGVPQFFYTAHADEVDTRAQLSRGGTADLFGTRVPEALVELIQKDEIQKCRDYLGRLARGLRELDAIVIEPETAASQLTVHEARTLRIFARRQSGERIELEPRGGLSGAKTFQARIFDNAGIQRARVFGKVDNRRAVIEEAARFRDRVAVRLAAGDFAPLAEQVLHGTGHIGALFYTLADARYQTLFGFVESFPRDGDLPVWNLEETTRPWRESSIQREIPLSDWRRRRVADDVIASFADELDRDQVQRMEELLIPADLSLQHGDLHGGNALVNERGRVILIDFGDVDFAPSCLDPVALELSFAFHPDRSFRSQGWPSQPSAERWWQLDDYTDGSSATPAVRACRDWALSVADPITVASTAFVVATRQLRHPDTDKRIAVAIARSAATVALELST